MYMLRKRKILFTVLALAFVAMVQAESPVELKGELNARAVLKPGKSYVIVEDLIIRKKGELVIYPGVEIRSKQLSADELSDLKRSYLPGIVMDSGKITARGTRNKPILFTDMTLRSERTSEGRMFFDNIVVNNEFTKTPFDLKETQMLIKNSRFYGQVRIRRKTGCKVTFANCRLDFKDIDLNTGMDGPYNDFIFKKTMCENIRLDINQLIYFKGCDLYKLRIDWLDPSINVTRRAIIPVYVHDKDLKKRIYTTFIRYNKGPERFPGKAVYFKPLVRAVTKYKPAAEQMDKDGKDKDASKEADKE